MLVVASAEIRPMQASTVAASLNNFNPMMSYADDAYQSVLPGRVRPMIPVTESTGKVLAGSVFCFYVVWNSLGKTLMIMSNYM